MYLNNADRSVVRYALREFVGRHHEAAGLFPRGQDSRDIAAARRLISEAFQPSRSATPAVPPPDPQIVRVRDLLHAAGLEGDRPTDAEVAALVGGVVAATTTQVSPTVRVRWTREGTTLAIEGWVPVVADEFHHDSEEQTRHTFRIETPHLRGQFEVIQRYPPPA